MGEGEPLHPETKPPGKTGRRNSNASLQGTSPMYPRKRRGACPPGEWSDRLNFQAYPTADGTHRSCTDGPRIRQGLCRDATSEIRRKSTTIPLTLIFYSLMSRSTRCRHDTFAIEGSTCFNKAIDSGSFRQGYTRKSISSNT